MDEFQFIKSIKQKSYYQPSLIKGIGDDAAVFRTTSEDIVTAVDTFVENIHFSKKTMNFFQVGYRALAANISDMAAMGADPKFYLVSMIIPKKISDCNLHEIYRGMNEVANNYKMDLIGGDTVSGERLAISITVIGYVPKGKARYRHQAKHDDIVFVTGTLGDSRAGLHILLNGINPKNNEDLIRRHQMPTPRVSFSTSIQTIHRLTLNDISDGIANELIEIAEASNVTITIKDELLPVHEKLEQFSLEQQTEWKYFGGEDFELVGTVAKKDWPFIQEIASKLSLRITNIGNVTYNTETNGRVFVSKENEIISLKKHGYIHLK